MVATDHQYNGFGEPVKTTANIGTEAAVEMSYSRDALGRITQKTEIMEDETLTDSYQYDLAGSLIENYGYDANGDRNLQTNAARGISAQSATYNLGDQLQSNGSTTYEYDTDGYLSKKTTTGGITTYQYSSQGRLLEVVTPDKTISYQHNAIGNRVAKLIDGAVTEKYLWLDKTTLLATYDASDTLLQRYQYTDGNTPTSFTQSGATYYIVTDHLGSPRVITDSTGAIVKKLDYDSFGNVISDSNPGFGIPFGFTGGLYDKDTGLVRFGFRDYDADVGRWTARDPIGFAGGDTNLYGYVISDPVNFVDPSGLILMPTGTSAQQAQINAGLNSLASKSPTAKAVIVALKNSSQTYTIQTTTGGNTYSPGSNVIK